MTLVSPGPGAPKCIVRVCWECLIKAVVHEIFNSHQSISAEGSFSAPLLLRLLHGGCKVVGAGRGDNPGTSWWTPEVEAKTWIWGEFSEAVEKDDSGKTLREHRMGKCFTDTEYSVDRELLISTED